MWLWDVASVESADPHCHDGILESYLRLTAQRPCELTCCNVGEQKALGCFGAMNASSSMYSLPCEVKGLGVLQPIETSQQELPCKGTRSSSQVVSRLTSFCTGGLRAYNEPPG